MDSLKELLKPKTMNRLSYVAIFCWVVIGVILLGIFADMENSESRFDLIFSSSIETYTTNRVFRCMAS